MLDYFLSLVYLKAVLSSNGRKLPLVEKQPPEAFHEKNMFKKFSNIHWKTFLSEFLFHKVQGLNACNCIKKKLEENLF